MKHLRMYNESNHSKNFVINEVIDDEIDIWDIETSIASCTYDKFIDVYFNYYDYFRKFIYIRIDSIYTKVIERLKSQKKQSWFDLRRAVLYTDIYLNIFKRFKIQRLLQDKLIELFEENPIDFKYYIERETTDDYIMKKLDWMVDSDEIGLL